MKSKIPTIQEMTISELKKEIEFQKQCIKKDMLDFDRNHNHINMHRAYLEQLQKEVGLRLRNIADRSVA